MRKFGWKGKQALNPEPIVVGWLKNAGLNAASCECYLPDGVLLGVDEGSNPDCPVHFPIRQDRDGVDLSRNCVTLDQCTRNNLCNGTCKLY